MSLSLALNRRRHDKLVAAFEGYLGDYSSVLTQ